jgi:hypothetical protein
VGGAGLSDATFHHCGRTHCSFEASQQMTRVSVVEDAKDTAAVVAEIIALEHEVRCARSGDEARPSGLPPAAAIRVAPPSRIPLAGF